MRRFLRSPRAIGTAALALICTILLSGCTPDPLAEAYLDGGNENYITGSGITEIPADKRGAPIEFSGTTDVGGDLARADFDGEVVVVNFWFAACQPCRDEAPDLEALSQKYDGEGASFVGVNTTDGAETSQAFARKFGVSYPSLLDAADNEVRLAFAGLVSPKAVPTTFVLDSNGRVAARILGQLQARSILDTIIADVVKEGA